jgi:YfiH family protein
MHDWIVPDWPAPPQVRAILTTRKGGVSSMPYSSCNLGYRTGDRTESVDCNRALLGAHLPAQPTWLKQVHGVTVVDAATAASLPEADGSFARRANVVCAVLTADCMPVLLCDARGRAVGIAHAGWRGLAAGVVEEVVKAMGTPVGDMLAYLGPAIGPAAFEVGDEVRDAFLRCLPQAREAFRNHGESKWFADLYLLARQRLSRLGVARVYGGGYCTYSDPQRFFSHRRDKVTGRMASLIWLDPNAAG